MSQKGRHVPRYKSMGGSEKNRHRTTHFAPGEKCCTSQRMVKC